MSLAGFDSSYFVAYHYITSSNIQSRRATDATIYMLITMVDEVVGDLGLRRGDGGRRAAGRRF